MEIGIGKRIGLAALTALSLGTSRAAAQTDDTYLRLRAGYLNAGMSQLVDLREFGAGFRTFSIAGQGEYGGAEFRTKIGRVLLTTIADITHFRTNNEILTSTGSRVLDDVAGSVFTRVSVPVSKDIGVRLTVEGNVGVVPDLWRSGNRYGAGAPDRETGIASLGLTTTENRMFVSFLEYRAEIRHDPRLTVREKVLHGVTAGVDIDGRYKKMPIRFSIHGTFVSNRLPSDDLGWHGVTGLFALQIGNKGPFVETGVTYTQSHKEFASFDNKPVEPDTKQVRVGLTYDF